MYLFKNNFICKLISIGIFISLFLTAALLLFWLVYVDKNQNLYTKSECKIFDQSITSICKNDKCHEYANITLQFTDRENTTHTEFLLLAPVTGQKISNLIHKYPIGSTIPCYYSQKNGLAIRLDEYYSKNAYLGLSVSILFFIAAGIGLICFGLILCDRYWF